MRTDAGTELGLEFRSSELRLLKGLPPKAGQGVLAKVSKMSGNGTVTAYRACVSCLSRYGAGVQTVQRLLVRKNCQHPGVAIKMVTGNLAAGKKTDQRHIAQSAADDLQLGTGAAKVRSTPT